MSDSTLYTQCKLIRGNTIRYAWIPARYAKVGKSLEIEGVTDWTVEEKYDSVSADQLAQLSHRYTDWIIGQ